MRKLILLACLSYFVIGLAHVVAGAVLEPVMTAYQLDYSSAGQWITNQFMGFLIGVLAAPALSSRIGRRGTLVLAMGALTLAEAVYSMLPPWDIILIIAPVAGLGFGMTEAVVGALIMDVFVKGKASAMGWLEVCFGIGALVMPGVASLLIQGGIWQMSFPVLTALAGICLLLWLTVSFGSADEAVAHVPRRHVQPGSGAAAAPGVDGPVLVREAEEKESESRDSSVRESGGRDSEALRTSSASPSRGLAKDAEPYQEAGAHAAVAEERTGPASTAGAERAGLTPTAGAERTGIASAPGVEGESAASAGFGLGREKAAAGTTSTGAMPVGKDSDGAMLPTRARYAKGSLPLLIVGMLFFFLYVGMEMVFANYLPSVMTAQSGLQEAEAAAVLSLFWGTMVAGRLFIGAATRAAGYRTYLLISVGASLVSLVIMSRVSGLSWMLALVALSGLFMAGIFAVALIYVNEKLPGMTDRTTSLLVACGGLGGALFPKLAGWILDIYDWQRLLQLTAVMAAALLVLLLALLAMRGARQDGAEPTSSEG